MTNKRILSLFAITLALLSHSAPLASSGGVELYRPNKYDYAPSVIQDGQLRLKWWCGQGPDQMDHIFFQATDLSSGVSTTPEIVLSAIPGSPYQSLHTCDPSVVVGPFNLPWAGQYKYAMYYTATSDPQSVNNSVSVVFSNDGRNWQGQTASYNPILRTSSRCTGNKYGVGQTAAWNRTGFPPQIQLFYIDTCANAPCENSTSGCTARGAGAYTAPNVAGDSTGIFFDWTHATKISWNGAVLDWNVDFAIDSSTAELIAAVPNNNWIGSPPEKESIGVFRMPLAEGLAR